MDTKLFILLQTHQYAGILRVNPAHITTDLPTLQKELRGRLQEVIEDCKDTPPGIAPEVYAAADQGVDGTAMLGQYDTLYIHTRDCAFTGFTHIRRSDKGPTHITWEIQQVPVWKLDPAPPPPEPLIAIHMNEQSLQGVYSNMQGGATVVYIDEDKQYYDKNEETDHKLAALNALVKEGLVREIHYCREGTAADLDAVLRAHQ